MLLFIFTSSNTFSFLKKSRGYQKNGMSKIMSENKTQTLPPCRVCGDKAGGFHYGVNTCEACKGFFHRSLRRYEEYKCRENRTSGFCEYKPGKRKSCQYCRFQRCLEAGMSKDAIKTGRYTYAKRTQDTKELQRLDFRKVKSKRKETVSSTSISGDENIERESTVDVLNSLQFEDVQDSQVTSCLNSDCTDIDMPLQCESMETSTTADYLSSSPFPCLSPTSQIPQQSKEPEDYQDGQKNLFVLSPAEKAKMDPLQKRFISEVLDSGWIPPTAILDIAKPKRPDNSFMYKLLAAAANYASDLNGDSNSNILQQHTSSREHLLTELGYPGNSNGFWIPTEKTDITLQVLKSLIEMLIEKNNERNKSLTNVDSEDPSNQLVSRPSSNMQETHVGPNVFDNSPMSILSCSSTSTQPLLHELNMSEQFSNNTTETYSPLFLHSARNDFENLYSPATPRQYINTNDEYIMHVSDKDRTDLTSQTNRLNSNDSIESSLPFPLNNNAIPTEGGSSLDYGTNKSSDLTDSPISGMEDTSNFPPSPVNSHIRCSNNVGGDFHDNYTVENFETKINVPIFQSSVEVNNELITHNGANQAQSSDSCDDVQSLKINNDLKHMLAQRHCNKPTCKQLIMEAVCGETVPGFESPRTSTDLGLFLGGDSFNNVQFSSSHIPSLYINKTDVVKTLVDSYKENIIQFSHLSKEDLTKHHKEHMETCHLKNKIFGELKYLPENDYDDIYSHIGIDVDNRRDLVSKYLQRMERTVRGLVKFAKVIPGFTSLDLSDQVDLIRLSRSEIAMLVGYPTVSEEFPICWGLSEKWECPKDYEGIPSANDTIKAYYKYARRIQRFNPSTEELVLLKAILVMSYDRDDTVKSEMAEAVHWELCKCLQEVIAARHSSPGLVLAKYIMLLYESRYIAEKFKQFVRELRLDKYSSIMENPLMWEMYSWIILDDSVNTF